MAHALCSAIRDRLLNLGVKSARLASRLWVYYHARLAEENGAELEDGGAYVSLAAKSLREYGFPSEAVWQFDPLGVYDPPPLLAVNRSHDQRGKLRVHRLSDGAERETEIRECLVRNIPLVIGTQVDAAFEEYAGGWWDFSGPSLGGHAIECVGFDQHGVECRNSWSKDFGDHGYIRLGWRSVRDPQVVSDAFAIDFAPNFSEAA